MEMVSRNIGNAMYAAVQDACNQSEVTSVGTAAFKDQMRAYLAEVAAADEATVDKKNRRLLAVSISVVAGIFLVMIVIVIVAKARCHRVDWGRMSAYCFGVFVLFCLFELALYFVIIRNYLPMTTMRLAELFIERLRRQLTAMQSRPGGYTPPQSVRVQLPDLAHPLVTYALQNLGRAVGPLKQVDDFHSGPAAAAPPAAAAGGAAPGGAKKSGAR